MVKVVGRYQIQARIGQGAMANVYRAYDPSINRVLAIKVLKREYCRNPEFTTRFLREARAAGALSHPNIVTIYDVGEIEGFPYIAMELLDGEPLDKVAQRQGQFPPGDVLSIGCQLADALRYAHGQGVVHRDIKPSNIMLGKDGRAVKILDFGIARLSDAEGASEQMSMTQVGQVLGTPRYMSPEQALGRPLDGRSDLFSVGALLYELITGKPAFTGQSAATLALQITQLDPPPIDVDCPRGLKFIVNKLLSKRPEQRFANGGALHTALQRERASLEAAQGADRRRLSFPVRAALVISAVTAVALMFGIGAVLDAQNRAMERVAVTAGSSIVSFVAANAALPAAENAMLPAEQQDWLPVQAFIATASTDPNVTQMIIADDAGVIRAASDPDLVGAHYMEPQGRRVTRNEGGIAVTSVRASDGTRSFRFARGIEYAGQRVGLVDISVGKTELESAALLTRLSLIGLGLMILALVAVLTVLAARYVMQPVRALRTAFKDAAEGNLDFRMSQRRADEFGDLFDGFNALMDVVAARAAPVSAQPALNLDATMIAPSNDVAPAKGVAA